MIIDTLSKHQRNSVLPQVAGPLDNLTHIEDALGEKLLRRIAEGSARARPIRLRRERKGYIASKTYARG